MKREAERIITWLRRHANKARQLDLAGEESGALTAIDWIENWIQKEGNTETGAAPVVNAESTARDRKYSIGIDGLEVDFVGEHISYEEVVRLAGLTGNPSVAYRSLWRGDSRRIGTMYPGCRPVIVEAGMYFNVMHTGNA